MLKNTGLNVAQKSCHQTQHAGSQRQQSITNQACSQRCVGLMYRVTAGPSAVQSSRQCQITFAGGPSRTSIYVRETATWKQAWLQLAHEYLWAASNRWHYTWQGTLSVPPAASHHALPWRTSLCECGRGCAEGPPTPKPPCMRAGFP